MRLTGQRDPDRVRVPGRFIVWAALLLGLAIVTVGIAIWPKVAAPGAAILCGGGEAVYESRGAQYRPGDYIVSLEIYCRADAGRGPARDITLQAAGLSILVYAAAGFLLVRFVLLPLALRRMRRRAGQAADRIVARGPSAWPGTSTATGDGAGTGDAGEEEDGDIAARLAQLKALRDQGLITSRDYEAKKAELLAGL
jgi:hypothetical protein